MTSGRTAIAVWLLAASASCSFTSLDGFATGMQEADAALPEASVDAEADAAPEAEAGPPRTCKELGAAADGYYPTAFGELYCNMTSDGGGWTLVGRSAGTEYSGGFGWRSVRGSVRDDERPYSLGALLLDLPFTEVLVGAYVTGKAPSVAYKLPITRATLLEQTDTSILVASAATVHGTCTPPDGSPEMLLFAGYTRYDNHFFFRDEPAAEDEVGGSYGLFSAEWIMAYSNCKQGGLLNGEPGLVFVR